MFSEAVNKRSYHLLGLIILIYFVVFLKLDSFHLRWWDESMFAVNTYEMMHNGKYFSAYFDGVPDNFNTKPPFTIWTQIIFVKLLGYNELALRLPSAIAAALSIILLFLFIEKNFNIIWAWMSALVLLTSQGFIGFHTARTGDSDSLLTLFLLLANIYFMKFLWEDKKQHILFFFLFISLAFATKMYAALLFSPAYFFILIKQKKFKDFILNKFFIGGIALFLVSAFTFIFLREGDSPGYLKEVFFKDAGRMFSVVENHLESATFYLDNLIFSRFSIWFIFSLIGIIFIFSSQNEKEKNLLSSFALMILSYLVVITISVTKLEWYDMPLFPYLATLSAYAIYSLFQKVANEKNIIVFLIVIFIYPYYTMFWKSQGNTIKPGERILEGNEEFIFRKSKENENLDGVKVYYSTYKGSLLFYKYKLAEKGQNISLTNSPEFNTNDKVLVCNDSLKVILRTQYKFAVLDKERNAQLIRIESKL